MNYELYNHMTLRTFKGGELIIRLFKGGELTLRPFKDDELKLFWKQLSSCVYRMVHR